MEEKEHKQAILLSPSLNTHTSTRTHQEQFELELVFVLFLGRHAVTVGFAEEVAVNKRLELLQNQENTLVDEEVLVRLQARVELCGY